MVSLAALWVPLPCVLGSRLKVSVFGWLWPR
jgi:hypothetical protein